MVVPIDVREVDGDGGCVAEVFGSVVRMRCVASQRRGSARACLHAEHVALVDASAPGITARLERAVYKGGHFRLDVRATGAADHVLHLDVPEPLRIDTGADVRLTLADGWVIPSA